MNMKTAGIIGGIGPESTIDYYRSLVEVYRQQVADGSYPPLIINSINLAKMRDLIIAGAWNELIAYLVGEIEKLARAGAEFGAIAANTPHIVFDAIRRKSPIPLISIVEATCDAARAQGLTRLALLGTRFTMSGTFFPEVFSRAGIALVVPQPDEQKEIHDKYMNELINGVFRDETRDRFLAIIERLKTAERIEGVILGGTELPLLLRQEDAKRTGIPFLDTTRIHVQAIVNWMLERRANTAEPER